MKLHCLPLALCLILSLFTFENGIATNHRNHSNLIESSDLEPVNLRQVERGMVKQNSKSKEIVLTDVPKEIAQTSTPQNKANLSTNQELSVNSYEEKAVKASESQKFNADSFGLGMYYGFAAMVILLNMICFLVFNEKVFLYFSIASSAMIIFYSLSDGIIGMNMTSEPLYISSLLLVIVAACSALFSNHYLNLKEFYPKIRMFSTLLLGFAGVLALGGLIVNETSFSLISRIVSFTVMISFFGAGILLFSRKNYAKFYVIGMTIPLLFIMDHYILKPNGIEFLGVRSSHLKIASVFELLLISYAIVYRMQAIKEEIVLRQTEMRIFLKRQEALTRQSVERLMEDMYLENLIMHYDLEGMEIKLLQYISEGKENSKIARKLKITVEDVEELTKELYHKLEIQEHIKEDYRMVDSQPDYIYN